MIELELRRIFFSERFDLHEAVVGRWHAIPELRKHITTCLYEENNMPYLNPDFLEWALSASKAELIAYLNA